MPPVQFCLNCVSVSTSIACMHGGQMCTFCDWFGKCHSVSQPPAALQGKMFVSSKAAVSVISGLCQHLWNIGGLSRLSLKMDFVLKISGDMILSAFSVYSLSYSSPCVLIRWDSAQAMWSFFQPQNKRFLNIVLTNGRVWPSKQHAISMLGNRLGMGQHGLASVAARGLV